MITIDGSSGEGGGQVLRTTLALSVLTRQAVHITNIRAGRKKPGLRPQHLKSVDAAAAISKAEVEGAVLNSNQVLFKPKEIRSGRYKFDIGTAGSTSLVFQTIYLPLAQSSSASSIIVTGGTHVLWSPCFHYLQLQWLKYLREMGFDILLILDQAGFYPQGNGRISTVVRRTATIHPLNILHRGKLVRISGISAVANLGIDIAKRQKKRALKRLINGAYNIDPSMIKIKLNRMPSRTKGTFIILLAEFENCQACYFSLGKKGKPAEQVAEEAVDQLESFIETNATVDQYLADQILLPMSVAKGNSEFITNQVTQHLTTNAQIIMNFLPCEIDILGDIGNQSVVRVKP